MSTRGQLYGLGCRFPIVPLIRVGAGAARSVRLRLPVRIARAGRGGGRSGNRQGFRLSYRNLCAPRIARPIRHRYTVIAGSQAGRSLPAQPAVVPLVFERAFAAAYLHPQSRFLSAKAADLSRLLNGQGKGENVFRNIYARRGRTAVGIGDGDRMRARGQPGSPDCRFSVVPLICERRGTSIDAGLRLPVGIARACRDSDSSIRGKGAGLGNVSLGYSSVSGSIGNRYAIGSGGQATGAGAGKARLVPLKIIWFFAAISFHFQNGGTAAETLHFLRLE